MVAGAEAGAEAMADGTMYSDEDVWVLADVIPPGTTAAICVLEHRGRSRCATPSWTPAGSSSWTSGFTEDLVRYGAEAAAE